MKPTAIIAILLAGALGYFVNHFTLAPKLKVAQETQWFMKRKNAAQGADGIPYEGTLTVMLNDSVWSAKTQGTGTSLRGDHGSCEKDSGPGAESVAGRSKSRSRRLVPKSQGLRGRFEPSDYYAAAP